jgi:hypothetical protein
VELALHTPPFREAVIVSMVKKARVIKPKGSTIITSFVKCLMLI